MIVKWKILKKNKPPKFHEIKGILRIRLKEDEVIEFKEDIEKVLKKYGDYKLS
jgi:HEPN domain-containing protein